MTTERPDYRIYMNDETWTLNDAITIVNNELEYKLKSNKTSNISDIDLKDKKNKVVNNIVRNIEQYAEGEPQYYDILDYDGELLEPDVIDKYKTRVNIKEFIKYVNSEKGAFPDELYEWYLQKSGCAKEIPVSTYKDCTREQTEGLPDYEDIITAETILKLKSLSLPQMKQKVAFLTEDKKKNDAAVIAAAKIGLLFYEEGLQKPTNEKLFVSEYKKHLDKLPVLQNETIKRIYKNLPEPYRHSHGGGKIASGQLDLAPIIKAAVYAGSIYDTDDVKILKKLKAELVEHKYVLPSDDVLNKIIEAVKET